MAMRFFKKLDPKTNPVLSNGQFVKFTTLDHVQGWFATDSDFVQGEFLRLMQEGRFGITEVSAEEFTREYIEKKTLGVSRAPWREEISGTKVTGSSPFATLGAEGVAAAVGIKEPAAQPVVATDPPKVEPPKAATEFKPPVGKRRPRIVPSKPA